LAHHFLSPSSITMYLRCPRKYYLRYIGKRTPKSSIHLVRGKAVHKAIADFTAESSEIRSDFPAMLVRLRDHYDRVWSEHGRELEGLRLSKEDEKKYYDESVDMLHKWLQRHMQFQNLGVRCSGTELKLFSRTHKVMGIIDAIYQKNGKVSLVDYKTANRDDITEDIKTQMAIYALLYKENKGELPDMISIAFLKHDKMKHFKTNEQIIAQAENLCKEIHKKTMSEKEEDYPCTCGGWCTRDFE